MAKRGGPRAGAGRKPTGEKPKVKRNFSLTESNLHLISDEAQRLDKSVSGTLDHTLSALHAVDALPGLDGLSTADKLQVLCELWTESYQSENESNPTDDEPGQMLPPYPDDALAALSKAVDDMDYKYSREAFQDTGFADNKDKLKYALNKRARAIYADSEHAREAGTAGRHEQAKQVIEDSDALTEIKGDYGSAVAACFALELIPLDLTWWASMRDDQKRFDLWCAFQTWDY